MKFSIQQDASQLDTASSVILPLAKPANYSLMLGLAQTEF
jgi:hypothetical protein